MWFLIALGVSIIIPFVALGVLAAIEIYLFWDF